MQLWLALCCFVTGGSLLALVTGRHMTVFAGIAVPRHRFHCVVDSSARDGWQFSPVQQVGSKVAAVHWSPSIGIVSVKDGRLSKIFL